MLIIKNSMPICYNNIYVCQQSETPKGYFLFFFYFSQFPASPIPPVSSASLFPIFPLPGSAILHCIWLCGSPTPLLWHSQFSFLILVPHSGPVSSLPTSHTPVCPTTYLLHSLFSISPFPHLPVSHFPDSLF
jgi:hypothetical protein